MGQERVEKEKIKNITGDTRTRNEVREDRVYYAKLGGTYVYDRDNRKLFAVAE